MRTNALNRCSHIVERYDVFMKRSAEFVHFKLALVAENVNTMPNIDVMFGYSNCTPSTLIFSKVSDTCRWQFISGRTEAPPQCKLLLKINGRRKVKTGFSPRCHLLTSQDSWATSTKPWSRLVIFQKSGPPLRDQMVKEWQEYGSPEVLF